MELSEYRPCHSTCVHFVVWCEADGCDFRNDDYLSARKAGIEHHEATGHEVAGEEARAVWIGEQGRKYNKATADALLGAMGLQSSK